MKINMLEHQEIIFDERGKAGLIMLNRPKAFNALTANMIAQMQDMLEHWQNLKEISHVIIEAAPGKAFCSGGDIRIIYELGRAKDPKAQEFFQGEYRLDATIKNFKKPYIALMDGITMGGGVGVSLLGSVRVATENFLFAMPETGIGLFPDVGGSYFLPRCPGELGMYLGLTGARLKAADALYAGLIDYYVPATKLNDLKEALLNSDHPAAIVKKFAENPGKPPLEQHREMIDELFAGETLEEIIANLAQDGSDWAKETLGIIAKKSPTSLKITFHQLRVGADLSFNDCMMREYRMTSRILQGHDFFEGIRATVIDKDMMPKWQPSGLAEVSDQDVAAYFEPLEKELKL